MRERYTFLPLIRFCCTSIFSLVMAPSTLAYFLVHKPRFFHSDHNIPQFWFTGETVTCLDSACWSREWEVEFRNTRISGSLLSKCNYPAPLFSYLHTNTENFSHLIHSVSVHFPSCCSKPLWLFLIACVPLLCLLLEFHTSICWTQINCELSKVRLWFYIFISQPRLKLQKTQRILGYKIQSWVQDIP